jgi:hypothetical protein
MLAQMVSGMSGNLQVFVFIGCVCTFLFQHLASEAYPAAEEALSLALSLDFGVKSNPKYYIIKAQILDKKGQTANGLKELETAMTLSGVCLLTFEKRVTQPSLTENIRYTTDNNVLLNR